MHSNSTFEFSAEEITSDYEFFSSTGEYFNYWHWRLLPNVLESKYYPKTFQNLVYYFYTLCSQITICTVYCRLAQLWLLKLYWFSAAYYEISLEGYQIICVRSFSFAKGQQAFENTYKQVSIQSGSPKKNNCWYGTQKLPKTAKQEQLFS